MLRPMQELIDGFIQHLATERGLSVNYQLLVRRFLEAFASWFKEKHHSDSVAAVTTAFVGMPASENRRMGVRRPAPLPVLSCIQRRASATWTV